MASLRVLIAMLDLSHDDDVRARRQSLLARLGAHRVAIMMASCDNGELCHLGVKLGVALLAGGNRDVQVAFYDAMADSALRAEIAPFDGSAHSLLQQLRQRLRRGAKEIAERKLYMVQQAERRAVFDEQASSVPPQTNVPVHCRCGLPHTKRCG